MIHTYTMSQKFYRCKIITQGSRVRFPADAPYQWKCSFINNSINIKLYIHLNCDYQCSRPTLQLLHIVQVVMSL